LLLVKHYQPLSVLILRGMMSRGDPRLDLLGSHYVIDVSLGQLLVNWVEAGLSPHGQHASSRLTISIHDMLVLFILLDLLDILVPATQKYVPLRGLYT
jgi:hypothetical protein